MKVRVLKPLNHNGKTVKVGCEVELNDDVAKKLISTKAVEEVKATKTVAGGTNA